MKLNNIDLNKLYVFFSVVERGGITPAAAQLLLTRSAVSQSISGLEASLDTALFHRIGKRMIPTEAGRQLFEGFRACQNDLNATLRKILPSPLDPAGPVRLGLFIGFSKTRLTDFISRFLRERARIQVRLVFASQADLADLLAENKIDLAMSVYPLSQENRLISSTRLFQEELVLVSGKKHFIARPSLREVQALPMVEYYQNSQLARTWIRHHFGRDVTGELNIRAYGATIDFVLELILKNAGVGIIPRHVAEPYLRKNRLFQMRTGKAELADFIWLNEVRGLSHEPAPRIFLEEMRRDFS